MAVDGFIFSVHNTTEPPRAGYTAKRLSEKIEGGKNVGFLRISCDMETIHRVRILPPNTLLRFRRGGGGMEWITGLCSFLSVRRLVRTWDI